MPLRQLRIVSRAEIVMVRMISVNKGIRRAIGVVQNHGRREVRALFQFAFALPDSVGLRERQVRGADPEGVHDFIPFQGCLSPRNDRIHIPTRDECIGHVPCSVEDPLHQIDLLIRLIVVKDEPQREGLCHPSQICVYRRRDMPSIRSGDRAAGRVPLVRSQEMTDLRHISLSHP